MSTAPDRARTVAMLVASGILVIGTLAVIAYEIAMALTVRLIGRALEAVTTVDGRFDPTSIVWRVAVAVLVGWVVGLGSARSVGRSELAPAPVVGMCCGLTGIGAGALVMHLLHLI